MLSADLWKLFGPLIAGAYGLFGIALLAWLLNPALGRRVGPSVPPVDDVTFLSWLRDRYRRLTTHSPTDTETAKASHEYFALPLLACTVFALGVILDSAVDDFVDSTPMAGGLLTRPINLVLPEETELRFSAFFEWTDTPVDGGPKPTSCNESPAQARWPGRFTRKTVVFRCDADYARVIQHSVASGACQLRPGGLGRELLDEPRLYAHFLETKLDRELRNAANSPRRSERKWRLGFLRDPTTIFGRCAARDDRLWHDMCQQAENLARKIYYDASNWAIRDERVSADLGRWASQVALLGSTTIVAMYSLVVLLIAAPASIIRHFWPKRQEGVLLIAARAGIIPHVWPKRSEGVLLSPRRKSMFAWMAVSAVVTWLSAYGYTIAQRNAIERTLGMYVSAAHYDADLKWPAGTAAIQRLCAGNVSPEELIWCDPQYLKSIGVGVD